MNPIRLILDTNILVQAVRANAVWDAIKARFDPMMIDPRPGYCCVTEGELRAFAKINGWDTRKVNQMEFLLGYFEALSIEEPEVMNAYSHVDFESRKVGRKMGKNDLWIAATALANKLTLLTTDLDFDHISPMLIRREWIDPNTAIRTP